MNSVRNRFIPFILNGETHWHQWIVTEIPLAGKRTIGSETRVAYQTVNSLGPVVTTVEAWESAQQKAAWNLAPAEVNAFRNLTRRDDGGIGPSPEWLAANP